MASEGEAVSVAEPAEVSKNMETYLFFGSFNPIHKGHISLIEYILENTNSDIWVIVSPQNPHKDPHILASFSDRFKMVELATELLGDRVKVLDIEESMPKPSYTINTLEKLHSMFPERKFCLLAGSDIAETIQNWFRYEDIVQLVNIKIYPRLESERAKCSPELINAPVTECSSTEFRNDKKYRILPDQVASYIKDNNLY